MTFTKVTRRNASKTNSPLVEQVTFFDDIGNRTQTRTGGNAQGTGLRQASYTANLLNQYDSRDVPGAFDVMGIANAGASVTVNSSAADYRRGEFFQELVTVDNDTAPVWEQVNVNTSGGGADSGHVFVPANPEAFTHDSDGNLTDDGRWECTWDLVWSWCRLDNLLWSLGHRVHTTG